jgi:chromosome segregation ATPase
MPISGPQAHQQLIAAYDQTAAQLERLRGQLGQVEQHRDRLEDDRDQTLTKLAEYYLPDLTTDSIQKTWAGIRPSMHEILLRKEGRLRELKTQLEDENFFRTNLEANLKEINDRLDAAEQRQAEIAGEVEAFLGSQAEFVELSNRAALAEIALQRAQDNLDEVSQDAARKLPAFNECNLFSYLKDRHFGTPQYTSGGFTRRMDRAIAKMVNYSESKRNFDYLTNTPNTMRTIIAEDRGALEIVLDELQQHRDRAAHKFGLITQLNTVEMIVRERETALATLKTQAEACEATQSQLNELENPRCEFYREAVDLFRGMLANTESSELRQEARRTPEITDDQIVASLRGIETQLDQTDLTTSRHHDELQQSQLVHEAVGRLIQRFRASGYDRAHCQFSDALDLIGSIDRIRRPADVDALWDSLRRTQNWGPTTMDKITAVATHPMTQVMVNAMAHAAAGAMSEHARRAGQRTDRRRGW